MDMNLGLPGSIIDIFARVPETGVLDEDVIARIGGALGDAVRNLPEEWRNDRVAGLKQSSLTEYDLSETASFGSDGVLVELGPSWYEPQGPNIASVAT